VPNKLNIRDLGPGEFNDPQFIDRINELEDQADRDVYAMNVNFRWGRDQVAVVKKAAALIGVPYQTYLKQVVYKQDLSDIESAKSALGTRDN